MEAEHHGIVSDNSSMRDALTQKNHIIDHLVYRLDKSAEDMEVLRFENEDIRSRLRYRYVVVVLFDCIVVKNDKFIEHVFYKMYVSWHLENIDVILL